MNRPIDHLQTDLVTNLFAANDVILAYLFGSQARGDSGPLSDVNIAVLFAEELTRQERFKTILTLSSLLGAMLQRDDVQVVDLKDASPLMRHRVYYDGRLLYCPDDGVRVKFEMRVLRDYVDAAPLRRLKEKYLLQRFGEIDQ